MKNFLLAVIVLGVIGAGVYYGIQWKNKSEAEKLNQKAELLVQASRRTIKQSILLAGDIGPEVQVEVKPEVSSKIRKILVQLGDVVKSGQLLAELDDNDLQTDRSSAEKEIANAKFTMEKSKRTFGMNEKLWAKKLISEQAFADSKTDLDIAKNAYEKAEKALQSVEDKIQKTKILSPLNGTILSLPVVEGQVVVAAASVNSGTLMMTVADLTNLIISVHVNQVDVAKIKPHNPVNFKVDAIGQNVIMKGQVEMIAPLATIKNNIKGFALQINITESDPAIRPGMTADVDIPVGKAENVVSIPLSAVFKDADDRSVIYVKKPDGTFDKRYVKVGISNIDYVEILNGLEDGESVSLIKPTQK